jgi:hypothetical protein
MHRTTILVFSVRINSARSGEEIARKATTLVCSPFCLLVMAKTISPVPHGIHKEHRKNNSIRRNLFGSEPRSRERLKSLIEEIKRAEAEQRAQFHKTFNFDLLTEKPTEGPFKWEKL